MYIYDMPFSTRHELCQLMDSYEPMWRNLAAEIGLKTLEVCALDRELIRPNGSPTEKLLRKWGHSNATVDMLAYKLITIEALRAYEVIQDLVSKEVDRELSQSLPTATTNSCQFSLKNTHSIISDENLPIPCPDPKDMGLNGEMKQNSVPDQYIGLDIKDERMKRISIYPIVKISVATNNFSKHLIIGMGKFSTTYKGHIDQTVVAIKVYQKTEPKIFSQTFYDEIDALSRHPHENLVVLLAISQDSPNKCFVYQFLENGSLRDRLLCKNNSSPLPWTTRHSILKDASRGLLHLHTLSPVPIIHKNIKSSNIFLGINFLAKLGDFGFLDPVNERTVQQTRVTKREDFDKLEELQAYLPDDFFRSGRQHTLQTDIYAFGMVILETCTGLDAIRLMKEKGKTLAKIAPEQLRYPQDAGQLISSLKDEKAFDWDDRLWMTMLMLGNLCIDERKNKRPITEHVFGTIEKLYYNVIDKVSSQVKENTGNKINNNDGDDDDDDLGGDKTEGDFTRIISNMKTACVRDQKLNGQETDIYSPSSGHDLYLGYRNESEDQMAMSNYVSIGEDIDMMKAKKPFSDICFYPALFKDGGPRNGHSVRKHFFKSDILYNSGADEERNGSEIDDNKLQISFSSKESDDISNVDDLNASSDSSDMESLIKKLAKQDKERYEKLEILKKEFPNEF